MALRACVAARLSTNQIMSIVRENQANLVQWDIRFAYLQQLLQLYDVSVEGKTNDIGEFMEARQKDIKESLSARTAKKNIFAGAFLSGSSTAIIFLFKHYEPVINQLIDKLVR